MEVIVFLIHRRMLSWVLLSWYLCISFLIFSSIPLARSLLISSSYEMKDNTAFWDILLILTEKSLIESIVSQTEIFYYLLKNNYEIIRTHCLIISFYLNTSQAKNKLLSIVYRLWEVWNVEEFLNRRIFLKIVCIFISILTRDQQYIKTYFQIKSLLLKCNGNAW